MQSLTWMDGCVVIGASVLNGTLADLYFTGEMSHHEILKSQMSTGAIVVLTEHTNCERGYLKDVLQPRLEKELSSHEFEIITSSYDKDPIEIISAGDP